MKWKPGQKKQTKYTAKQIAGLQARALDLWHADEDHAQALGAALLDVRRAMKHGMFKKWWQNNKLSQARVSYCMRVAQNKVAAAKAKRQSSENRKVKEASQLVTGKLNHLFRSCAGATDGPALFAIQTQLWEAVEATVAQAAALARWELHTRDAKKASDELNKAVTALVATISRPATHTAPKVKRAAAGAH
jgi:hypothetical protein